MPSVRELPTITSAILERASKRCTIPPPLAHGGEQSHRAAGVHGWLPPGPVGLPNPPALLPRNSRRGFRGYARQNARRTPAGSDWGNRGRPDPVSLHAGGASSRDEPW